MQGGSKVLGESSRSVRDVVVASMAAKATQAPNKLNVGRISPRKRIRKEFAKPEASYKS